MVRDKPHTSLAAVHLRFRQASAKLCGVEQRAPLIFGRATITLGIGPHSSCLKGRIRVSIELCYQKGAKCCAPRVCMCVCLSASLSARKSEKPHSELHEIFCTCYLWPWVGLPPTTVQCVMYFRFCE